MPKVAYFNGLDTKERITFGQLKADALALSRGLRDPKSPWGGLKRNQIACIFGANSIKVPVLVFGLLQAGAGITPSNPAYTVRELAHQIKQTSSVLLIAHSSMLDTAIAAAEECGLPKNRIILIDDGVKGFATISQIVARGHELTDDDVGGRVVFTEDDIKKKAVLLPFSSGTTGVPKGVSLTHYGLVSNVCIWSHVESATKKPPLPADVVETRVCFIPVRLPRTLRNPSFFCLTRPIHSSFTWLESWSSSAWLPRRVQVSAFSPASTWRRYSRLGRNTESPACCLFLRLRLF